MTDSLASSFRRPRQVVAYAVLLFTLVACNAVAGHGSIDPATAYFGPGGRAIPITDVPQGVEVDSAAAAVPVLAKSFPGAATGVSGSDLAAIRTVVLRAVSRLHADPDWLCGKVPSSDPVEQEFPTGLHWASDPKQDPYRRYEALYQLPGCDQIRFAGTYIGDQRFTVTRTASDIQVDHVGTFTYDARSLSSGARLPVHLVAQRSFGLRRWPEGWRIVRMVNAQTAAAPGHGPTLPRYAGEVPGILPGNQLGQPDPAALDRIRTALAGTISAGSVSVSFADHSSAVWRGTAPDNRTGRMWPSAGAAEYRYPAPAATTGRYRVREFVVDKIGDYAEYNKADAAGHQFTAWDPRVVPEVAGLPVDSNPFVALAVLNQLDAAGGVGCKPADRAESCYVVRVPVSRLAITDSMTTRIGHSYASYGVTEVAFRVGVTGGRIAMVSQDVSLPVVGHDVLEVHWRLAFQQYGSAGASPQLAAPPSAKVAHPS